MRVKLAIMTGWIIRTALCFALLLSAASSVRADEPTKDAPPPAAEATYDETQPGADDPRVREGFEAYKAGDFKKAYGIWLPLANAGNAEAQFRMARLYDFGEGVEKSGKSAIYWYEKAADKGHRSAQYNLGHILFWDESVSRDSARAVKYFLELAELGMPKAQWQLGAAYAVGDGIPKDMAKAYKWFFIASENGLRNADTSMARLNKFSTERQRESGRKEMREWFQNHPR